jgi:hypothetical protein
MNFARAIARSSLLMTDVVELKPSFGGMRIADFLDGLTATTPIVTTQL